MGSGSLGQAGLLKMEQHTLQSVVAGEGQPAEQQLWHLKLLALEVAERSLAGKRGKQPFRACCPTPSSPEVPLLRLLFTAPETPPVASTPCPAQANSRGLGVLQLKGLPAGAGLGWKTVSTKAAGQSRM